jgi:hypothetical protein
VLGVSVRTIQRMIAANKLLTFELHRRRWISPISIDHYLFKPSRLQQILKEIDAVAAMIAAAKANRHPGRTAKLEEHENV